LNGTQQLLVCADVSILGGTVCSVERKTEELVDVCEESGLEVNADKTKYLYMVMSRDQNAERSYGIKIDNSFFRRVEQVKYLGTDRNKSTYYSGRN